MFDALLRLSHRVQRHVSSPLLLVFAGLLLVAAVIGFVQEGDSGGSRVDVGSASSPSTSVAVTTTTARAPIEGFSTAPFSVTNAAGQKKDFCGLVADTDVLRARGLMQQRDLRGYDGMLFVFSSDVTASFYMANVPAPLSVAWFDGGGRYVSSAEMEVCGVAASECPRYGAMGPYRYAIETFKGGMNNLQAGPGSVLSIGAAGGCV